MNKIPVARAAVVFLFLLISTDCATIIHGSTQEIDVRSAPDNAEVWVDGAKMGTTPARITLKRGNDYNIKIVRTGYKEAALKIKGTVSSWIIGNIIFGGIIGCAVDFISGGAYDLKPESLDINLTKLEALNGRTFEIEQSMLATIKKIRLLDEQGQPEFVMDIEWVN